MKLLSLFPLNTKLGYEKLPTADSSNGSPFSPVYLKKYGWRSPSPGADRFPRFVRMSLPRFIMLAITSILCLGLIIVGGYRGHQRMKAQNQQKPREEHPWDNFTIFDGFYNGIGALVPTTEWIPEQEFLARNISNTTTLRTVTTKPPFDPLLFNPYAEVSSATNSDESNQIQECFLDEQEQVKLPNVFVYPGVPQYMTAHFMGSYEVLGLRDDICYDRFGRLGPYGYGYNEEEGGLGLGDKSEKLGADMIWNQQPKIDYRKINWGQAQDRCFQKNQHRFKNYTEVTPVNATASFSSTTTTATPTKGAQPRAVQSDKKKLPRQAFILRSYTGYKYDKHQLLSMRAILTELALKTGGEYDIHLLVQVRDDSIPIWTDEEVYRKTVEDNVPEEFWGITTLWSEQLMKLYYPAPFPDNFANPSGGPIHAVYRGAHFPFFWFAQQHPEYDFYWNWEMDLRFSGHYYEFAKKITDWAKEQPRKGLWERNAQYYIPGQHGNWSDFVEKVEQEVFEDPETSPVWGPVEFPNNGLTPSPAECTPPRPYLEDNYEWGVGEEADFISFNPLFDPSKTNWFFRDDVDGFSKSHPIPPRRCAIITVSRMSKRLLDIAHKETYKMRHTMFPEMWPPTVALHHGLKAVYVPHPVYFDRDWPLDYLDQVFNHPKKPSDSVFGSGEHNQRSSSFYFNSGFSGALWRRWFGYRENNHGGSWYELSTSGRMCLRSTLFHPIKFEKGPTE